MGSKSKAEVVKWLAEQIADRASDAEARLRNQIAYEVTNGSSEFSEMKIAVISMDIHHRTVELARDLINNVPAEIDNMDEIDALTEIMDKQSVDIEEASYSLGDFYRAVKEQWATKRPGVQTIDTPSVLPQEVDSEESEVPFDEAVAEASKAVATGSVKQ